MAAGEPAQVDELTLARSSSGYRQNEAAPLLTVAPGDQVRVDGRSANVVAVDRRKRTVEIYTGDDVHVADFEDVQIQETT